MEREVLCGDCLMQMRLSEARDRFICERCER